MAIQPGSRVERSLTPGSVHRYEVVLLPGQFFHMRLEQNHLDVVIRILSPTGTVLAEADNGADREDPFELST
jgi:hypothetical protein